MGKKSTPAPPDYEAAAERTAEGNKALVQEQTRANRPNQYTPWGASEWVEGPGGNWEQTISLTPQQQEALQSQHAITQGRSDLAQNMFGRVGEEYGDLMDWDQFGAYKQDLGTGDEARQSAIDAAYGQATSRLDPRMASAKEGLDAQLRGQGLRPGDEAYDYAMARQNEAETDAYNQAMFSAIKQGGAEGSRVFGMNQQSAAFNNQVRQSQIAEEMQKRGFSLNEINAILSGQQIAMPGMPSFSQAGVSQGADYLGAAQMGYQADMDAFNADQAAMNSLMSGAGSMAGMFMMSDRRLKRSIEYIGDVLGRKFYRWVYVWDQPGCGVIADENPDMIAGYVNGFAYVDMRRL